MSAAHSAPPQRQSELTGAAENRRNAVFIVCDDRILPAAKFLWWKLKGLNPRADTDILLFAPQRIDGVLGVAARPGESRLLGDLPLPDVYLHAPGYLTPTAYARLSAPRLLREAYRRLVYLDVDTFPLDRRLFALFDATLPTPVAAALDILPTINPAYWTEGRMRQKRFLFDRYHNTGVLLIDTDRFVAAGIDDRTYEAVAAFGTELMHADQTAMNLAVPDKFCTLSPAFNFRPRFAMSFLADRFPPSVLHFNGAMKPWHRPNPLFGQPHRELHRFLRRTGEWRFLWRNTKLRGYLRAKRRRDRIRFPPFLNADNPRVMALWTEPYVDEAPAAAGAHSPSSSS